MTDYVMNCFDCNGSPQCDKYTPLSLTDAYCLWRDVADRDMMKLLVGDPTITLKHSLDDYFRGDV